MAIEGKDYLATGEHWNTERSVGYKQLGWVKAPGPLQKIIDLAELTGSETVVDAGTGSQAVLDSIASGLNERGRIIGFDISTGMMEGREGKLPRSASLIVADFFSLPFANNSADLLVTRQVLHNLPNISGAITESYRVLKPGGKFIAVEYVALDPEVLAFEKQVFDIKEPGRNLWIGSEMRQQIENSWPSHTPADHYHTLMDYSVINWMKNSGLPESKQAQVVSLYRSAPESIVRKMNIIQSESDLTTNRTFAYIVASK